MYVAVVAINECKQFVKFVLKLCFCKSYILRGVVIYDILYKEGEIGEADKWHPHVCTYDVFKIILEISHG